MKVNVIFDLEQYHWVLAPVLQELCARDHEVVVSHTREDIDVDADISIGMQDVAWDVPRKPRPRVFVNHGVSCTKGWGMNLDIDYFIGQSQYWAERGKEKGDSAGRNFEVIAGTGWPRMDAIYSCNEHRDEIKEAIKEQFLLSDKPLILCFPTYKKDRGPNGNHFNIPLKGWERDYDYGALYKQLGDDYEIFVCPHQMDTTGEFHTSGIPKDRVIRFTDIRRIHFQVAADVIVSDASGIAFEACGIDTPVVMINSNEDSAPPRIEGESVFEIIDMGPWVNLEGLKEAVDSLIEDPSLYRDRREYWKDKVLGPVDGLVSKRIVDEMEKIVESCVSLPV